MKSGWEANDETKLAQAIISVLPAGSAVRYCSDDSESMRFAVQAPQLKLRSVVFSRASLRRLLSDSARTVKIEYLQRELAASASRRAEFRYPRLNRVVEAVRRVRRNATVPAAAAAAR